MRGLLAAPGFVASFQRTSRKGVPVTVNLYHQIDDGISDGWIVDLIEAHGPEGPVGARRVGEALDRLFAQVGQLAEQIRSPCSGHRRDHSAPGNG